MKTAKARFLSIGSSCGALLLASSLTVSAASDNEAWNQGQAELQKQLAPGSSAADYRKKIEGMGYKITSTNYNNDDYVEYELVKGDMTWEVQIDVDDNTKKATEVKTVANIWKTDATERAMGRNVVAGNKATYRNPYSERDRTSVSRLIREIEAWPVDQTKQFYKDALAKNGYKVTRTNTDDTEMLSLEAVKGASSVEVNVGFNDKTGKSTSVDADSMWVESEATSREREKQEARN